MKNKGLAILALTAALAAGSSMAAYAAGWASEDGSWVYYDSDGDGAMTISGGTWTAAAVWR